jgi:tRNA(fMet)-specific endonuclease VapC
MPASVRYLLDSNILSEIPKDAPSPQVLAQLQKHWAICVTASTVLMELYFGAALLPPERKKYKRLIADYDAWFNHSQALTVLTFDAKAAHYAAFENARLQKLGKPRPWRDSQIAAVAATQNLILVTRNVADFKPFKHLKIENWFE